MADWCHVARHWHGAWEPQSATQSSSSMCCALLESCQRMLGFLARAICAARSVASSCSSCLQKRISSAHTCCQQVLPDSLATALAAWHGMACSPLPCACCAGGGGEAATHGQAWSCEAGLLGWMRLPIRRGRDGRERERYTGYGWLPDARTLGRPAQPLTKTTRTVVGNLGPRRPMPSVNLCRVAKLCVSPGAALEQCAALFARHHGGAPPSPCRPRGLRRCRWPVHYRPLTRAGAPPA